MHVIAGKAVAFQEALQPEYATYIENVVKNAAALGKGMADGDCASFQAAPTTILLGRSEPREHHGQGC